MNARNFLRLQQTGTILPLTLILLVPLTMLAVVVAQRNNLEELMAASQRDGAQALMNAESGLALAHEVLDRVASDNYGYTVDQIPCRRVPRR